LQEEKDSPFESDAPGSGTAEYSIRAMTDLSRGDLTKGYRIRI
jgi:hypothetical protein